MVLILAAFCAARRHRDHRVAGRDGGPLDRVRRTPSCDRCAPARPEGDPHEGAAGRATTRNEGDGNPCALGAQDTPFDSEVPDERARPGRSGAGRATRPIGLMADHLALNQEARVRLPYRLLAGDAQVRSGVLQTPRVGFDTPIVHYARLVQMEETTRLGRVGWRFESVAGHCITAGSAGDTPVAHRDRAPAYEAGGGRFKSCQGYAKQAFVAQRTEHEVPNLRVAGSIPAEGTPSHHPLWTPNGGTRRAVP